MTPMDTAYVMAMEANNVVHRIQYLYEHAYPTLPPMNCSDTAADWDQLSARCITPEIEGILLGLAVQRGILLGLAWRGRRRPMSWRNPTPLDRQDIELALRSGKLFVAMANGKWWQARKNGATKLWKTRPDHFRIPIKAGLRVYGAITHDSDMSNFRIAASREDAERDRT